MSDLISRQAAIAVADGTDYTGLDVADVAKVTDEVVKGLKQLPSAERKGHWIEDGYQNEPCVCSVCGTPQDIKAKFLFSFCPNCGARMEGEKMKGEEDVD